MKPVHFKRTTVLRVLIRQKVPHYFSHIVLCENFYLAVSNLFVHYVQVALICIKQCFNLAERVVGLRNTHIEPSLIRT